MPKVETTNSRAPQPEPKSLPAYDAADFAKLSSRNLEIATRAARVYFNSATQLNQEFMGFLNSRIKKDIKSAQSLMKSKTSEEAFQAQAGFFEEAFRDYADETTKILNLAADMAKETMAPVEGQAGELLRNLEQRFAE